MDEEEIEAFHQDVDENIKEYGFFMMGVAGISLYSIGFFNQDKPELLFAIGDTDLADLFNRLCQDHKAGRLPIDKVFNCKWAKVNGKPMRCIVITQNDDEAEWICENVTLGVKHRSPEYRKFAIIQIADTQNRLPHEEGYNLGDQTISMMKYNIEGAKGEIHDCSNAEQPIVH